MFYYFYFYFGYIGVFLGSLLFGYFCYRIFSKSILSNNRNNIILYLLVVQCILFSFVRWQIGTSSFIIEYIAIKLITSNIKIKTK
jgi:oligosaccharide repeat unit polymerase